MRKLLTIVAATVVVVVLVAAIAVYVFFSGDGMRRALEQQASSWLGQPVKIKAARGQLFPRPGIGLSGIEVGEPVQLTLADVDLSTDLRALFSRRIEDARIVVSDSTIQMPLTISLPQESDSSKAGPATSGSSVEIVSIGEISLRNVSIRSRGREVRVSADSSLKGNHLTLRSFTAESGSTSLQVDGEADLEPRVDAKLRARANKIDLDELLALADAFSPNRPAGQRQTPSSPLTMKLAAQISADNATAAGVQLSKLAATMTMDGDRFALTPLAFGLFGGTYEGALNGRLGENMSVTLQSRLKGLDVAQLATFGGSPDTVTGTLSGEGTFSAVGADMSAALANANGKGSASIVEGTIKRLDLLRTVVLFFGRPAPETAAASDKFERIDMTYSLAKQVFRADTFAMRSRDADITGTAMLALESQALDGMVDLTLSEELSAQAGTDLARFTRENNRIILPANVGGTLGQPRITINAAAAARRGIQNEIQRRLKGLFGR
jgi:uncharacterized protein involved in outer membrane biogenesis